MGKFRFRDPARRLCSLYISGALLAGCGLAVAPSARAAGTSTEGVPSATSVLQLAQQAALGAVDQAVAATPTASAPITTTVASGPGAVPLPAQPNLQPALQAAAAGSALAASAVTDRGTLNVSADAGAATTGPGAIPGGPNLAALPLLTPRKRTAERARGHRETLRRTVARDRIRLVNRAGMPARWGAALLRYGEQPSRVACAGCIAPARQSAIRAPSRPSRARPLPTPPVMAAAALESSAPSQLPGIPTAAGGGAAGAGAGVVPIVLLGFAAAWLVQALLPGRLSLELAAWRSAPAALPLERPG
jgi:hypothetical protein